MHQARPEPGKKGYYVHLPATRLVLIGATVCLVGFDVFLIATDSYFPFVLKSWLAWSEPLTNAVGQYIFAVSGIGDDMVHWGAAARAPLMENLVACNWAILLSCYGAAFVLALVEALPKAKTVARDIEAATKSWSAWSATRSKARVSDWFFEGMPKEKAVAHDIEAATTGWGESLGRAWASLWILVVMTNLLLLTNRLYPSALYRSDSEIPLVCFLFFGGIFFTPRWILFHVLLLRAESRRILIPPEPAES